MIDLVVDYRDDSGTDYHSIFKCSGTVARAAQTISHMLAEDGYTVTGMVQVIGEHTLEDLAAFAEGRMAADEPKLRWIYFDATHALKGLLQ